MCHISVTQSGESEEACAMSCASRHIVIGDPLYAYLCSVQTRENMELFCVVVFNTCMVCVWSCLQLLIGRVVGLIQFLC